MVQPQIFLIMFLRFPRFEQTAKSASWRDAIANGQYLLFRRDAYERIGGHEAVQAEVVEDLVLAQRVKRAGLRLRLRGAEGALSTRMYRSLRELVDGWTKNIVDGGLRTVPPVVRGVVPPVALLTGLALWVFPPAALAAALAAGGQTAWLPWSAAVCLTSAIIWAFFTRWMGAPAGYGVLYPLGALVGAYIFVRSWLGGRQVTWKGRRYVLPPLPGDDEP